MPAHLGRYEILAPIASGGMATVYLARAVGAGGFERLVAVKSMHPHIAADPEFVAMFLDEARLAARLRHPNAVATIDVQEAPLFLVMDYVEGPSLHRVLREMKKREGRLPLGIALRVFLDVIDGLHAAHELTGADGQLLQLVHRDVSPHNMLMGADGVSRITDFGVARAESRLSSTRGDQVKGKIGYMAPEQVRSEPVDRRSDVYAAGAVLWELLVGRALVRGDNEGAMLSQVLAGARVSPRQLDPEIAAGIDAACMRALHVDPARRFQTAAELGEAVERAATDAGVPIATPRAVGAFVRELAVHQPPVVPARATGPGSTTLDGPASSPPGLHGSTSVAVVRAEAPPPRPSRIRFALIAAAVGLVLGGAAFVVSRGDRAEPAATVGAPPAAANQGTPLAPSLATAVSPATTASPATAAPAVAPAPSTLEIASAEVPSDELAPSAIGSADGASSSGPSPPRPAGRPVTAPPASPTSFRPADL